MADHYNIIIAGAGLVGSSLALALSKSDLRIAVLEAKPILPNEPFIKDSKPLALSYASVNKLCELGIWSELEKHAAAINTVHISDRGHFGITRITAQEQQVPALGYVIPAALLNNILNTRLFDSPKLNVLHSTKIINLNNDNHHWELIVEPGSTLTADLIIAADGTHSTLRQLAGIQVKEKNYQQSALSSILTLKRDHKNIAYERFLSDGALAFLPLPGLQGGCVWTGPTEKIQQLHDLSENDFLQQIQTHFGFRLGRFTHSSQRKIHPLSMLRAEEIIKNNLVLLGNAAQTLHPIAAQGFNTGLADVGVLADLITKTLSAGKNLSEINLQAYASQRQQQVTWTLNFTENLLRFFSNDFLPVTTARNLGLTALEFIPALKRKLADRLMGVDFS